MVQISNLKREFHYWDAIGDMIDQCIDIALNLSQSGHPGGSRKYIHFAYSGIPGFSRYNSCGINIQTDIKNNFD